MSHVVVDISAHGFGHLAQTASVLNALPSADLVLSIRSAAPETVLRERIRHPFTLIPYEQDTGMIMHDALRVDAKRTFAWYEAFHANYAARREQAMRDLAQLQPDLLYANVPYLSLDAAGALGIPAVALCSLNWADIFQAYCAEFKGAAQIHAEILNAYQQARTFLRPQPAMPMPELANTQAIAPLVQTATPQPEHLRAVANTPAAKRFVLVALGGIGMNYPLADWPHLEGVAWIFPDNALDSSAAAAQRHDFFRASQFKLPYADLLASSDLVLTKIGYGTQTEAVANQVPALCVMRGDWPEEPYLFAWHREHGEMDFMQWADVGTPRFATQVTALLEQPWRKAPIQATGAEEAAGVLMACLG